MSPSLAGDGLSAERRHDFVGSAAGRAGFQTALEFPELPSLVRHVFGPGGVGKSTPLHGSRLLLA